MISFSWRVDIVIKAEFTLLPLILKLSSNNGLFTCFIYYPFWGFWGPHLLVLRAYSWLCIQRSLMAVLRWPHCGA